MPIVVFPTHLDSDPSESRKLTVRPISAEQGNLPAAPTSQIPLGSLRKVLSASYTGLTSSALQKNHRDHGMLQSGDLRDKLVTTGPADTSRRDATTEQVKGERER